MKGPKKVEPRSCSMVVVESSADLELVRFLLQDSPYFGDVEFPFAIVEIGGGLSVHTMEAAEEMFRAPRLSQEVLYEQEYKVALQTGE